MFHFEITQPRGDRTEFYYVGALKGCELNTGAQSFDLFSEADHSPMLEITSLKKVVAL